MKIINIVGARPNFMKIAPLMKEYKVYNSIIPILLHTGQHYDENMSAEFFKDLQIDAPKYNLGVGSGSHAEQTGKIMIEFEKVCLIEKPDLILVVGDVNSTIACALVAKKLHIKVAHVEAGLRSFDERMPEEINRVLTDAISDFNFAPTLESMNNLKNEGKDGILVGDIMYDVFLDFKSRSEQSKVLEELELKDYYLMTMHRVSNVDDKERLNELLMEISKLELPVIYPMHPRTKKMVKEFGIEINDNIKVIEPVGYLDMVKLLSNAKLLLTDSGGMQKEAYFAKIPCVTLREDTEWVETLGKGNVLCSDPKEIEEKVKAQLESCFSFDEEFYGDGETAKRIVEALVKWTSH
jgi:UDP-GlcNAc3NAcA epimerase